MKMVTVGPACDDLLPADLHVHLLRRKLVIDLHIGGSHSALSVSQWAGSGALHETQWGHQSRNGKCVAS